jgi:serralysin
VDTLLDGRFAASWMQEHVTMTAVYDSRTSGKIIKGTAGNNILVGSDYSDTIFGYGGNDQIYGKRGNDVLDGGPGEDSLSGDLGNDTATFASMTAQSASPSAGVVANLTTQEGTAGDATGDTYSDIENLTGSKFDDVLTGDTDRNVLKGGAGNDKLYGLGENDGLYVGIGTDLADGGTAYDLVSYLGVPRGVTVDLDAPAANVGEALGDTYISIEAAGGTNSADILRGDEVRNHLWGYKGDDTLDGRAGSDILIGGPGADVLTGGTGNDYFRYYGESDGGDRVLDFRPVAGDKVQLAVKHLDTTFVPGALPASGLVSGPTPAPSTGASVFLYDTDTGQLFLDLDGTGSAPKVELMTLVGIPPLAAKDFALF